MIYLFFLSCSLYAIKFSVKFNNNLYSVNNKYNEFATKAVINKKAYTSEIKPVKSDLNLKQPLVKSIYW